MRVWVWGEGEGEGGGLTRGSSERHQRHEEEEGVGQGEHDRAANQSAHGAKEGELACEHEERRDERRDCAANDRHTHDGCGVGHLQGEGTGDR